MRFIKYIAIFINTLIALILLFISIYSISVLIHISSIETIFSAILMTLKGTPLFFLSELILKLTKLIGLTMLFGSSILLFILAVYIESKILTHAPNPLDNIPLEAKADYFFRERRYGKAKKIYSKLGRWDMVSEIYKMKKKYKKAAKAIERLGDESCEAAAELYEQIGDMDRARNAWRKAGHYYQSKRSWEKAAICFQKGSDKKHALESLEKHFEDINGISSPHIWKSKARRIIQLAEQLGEFLKAAKYSEKIGDIEAAAHFYSKGGNYLKAARMLFDAEKLDTALHTLATIDSKHPQYIECLLLQARILYKKEKYAGAIKNFLQYFKKIKPSEDNLEDFFYLGLSLEAMGRLKQARDVFKRINKIHPYFMNVDEHIDAIDKKKNEVKEISDILEKKAMRQVDTHDDAFPVQVDQRYTELEELGRGGSGIVYKSRDKLLDRTVALKQLPESVTKDPLRLQSFFKEAKVVAKLNHPNIVSIYDILKVGKTYYIVMEYINGVTVEKLLTVKGNLSLRLAMYISRYILLALSYAHRNGVIHQDIKPANIMLTEDKTVKLTDFGIAHLQGELPDYSSDLVVGTPKYISPEQLKGIPVDNRCDIYSFGITLYEMLTGELPFPLEGIMHHHITTPPTPARVKNPKIPESLDKLLLKCLEKDREKRYSSTKEIYEEIKKIVQEIEVFKKGTETQAD